MKICKPGNRFQKCLVIQVVIITFAFSVTGATVEFPIKVSANGRYFTDQKSIPFFIQADTPWSLFVALDMKETEQYLKNRHEKGFNTITVNLIEHWFKGETLSYPAASMNREGNFPFSGNLQSGIPDFTYPNENYFRYVDKVLKLALKYGFLVMMTPSYMGYKGMKEGWYDEVLANDAPRCREYGRYLGKRYAGYTNIVWIMDGDRNPDSLSRPLELEILQGIKDFDKIHLFTAHCAPANSSRDQWEGESWLNFNCVYTYDFPPYNLTVPEQCLRNYAKSPAMPAILFETCYENEHNATAGKIRAQMYWGWLCSIAGVQFGNLPVWRFGEGWQSALDWQGSCDASIMKKLVDSRNWYKLVPDLEHKVLFEGYGSAENYVSAAMAGNGETFIAYIPKGDAVFVDMQQMSGNRLAAWWFNPRNGLAQKAGEYSEKNKTHFTPPDSNDWVLIIDDDAYNFGMPGQMKDKN
jgi:hypothetical protein